MNRKLSYLILCIGSQLFVLKAFSQEKATAKFGNVSASDFGKKSYPIDSTANAIVLAEIGSSRIEGNNKNWFSLIFKRFKRIHVLNKNGYSAANVSIELYANGDDEENLDRLRAVTYNLENGKVVQTKLDTREDVFKGRSSKNRISKKFTFPNVKAGSIIEFEYVIISDYLFNLQPWEFQGSIPTLWSEYNLELPDFFSYVFFSQGDKKYDIRARNSKVEHFKVVESRGTGSSQATGFNANVTVHRWMKKNIPALKEEDFTSTLDNHISKIEFQLSEFREPLAYQNIMGSWPDVVRDLMKSEHFGLQLTRDNGWLKDDIAPLIKGVPGKLEQARNIYAYVRDNFTCTNYGRYTEQSLRTLTRTRKGNVAELNLLLTAMLRFIDVKADPVLLSTRSHGYAYALYPIMNKFNYVITRATIDGRSWLLDASEPKLGFGYLPLRCYNGHARALNETVDSIELNSDQVRETSYTTVFIVNSGKGQITGSMQQTPGYYESMTFRNKSKEENIDHIEKEMTKGFGNEVKLSQFTIDSVNNFDVGIAVKFDFNVGNESEDILYFNPMTSQGYTENPFKSAHRLYPVEMPYAIDQTYTLQLEVPAGYSVEELPKSLIVKLNDEGEGLFEYRISHSAGTISFRSRVRITRTVYASDEYEMLREFFNLVVKKHSEQIVFKKNLP